MSRSNLNFFPARRRPALVLALLVFVAAANSAQDDFTLPDMDGQAHSLSDYRGKWVLVNYWATWCPPCLEELPELEVFHTGAEGRAVVLGVNMEAIDKPELRAFVEQQFLSFPILVAGERPRRDQMIGPVEAMPTSYLVTPAGEIVARQVGQITSEAISEFIERYENDHGGGEKQ
jgi:thiol-disulfide isomerase/thioredoxin